MNPELNCTSVQTGDLSNFRIYFGKMNENQSLDNAQDLCNVMNKLQNQGFFVNEDFLQFIIENEFLLVSKGFLLMNFFFDETEANFIYIKTDTPR